MLCLIRVDFLRLTAEVMLCYVCSCCLHRSSSNPPFKEMDNLFSLANMIRIINMLIIFRLLRIVPNIKVRDGLWGCGSGMEFFSYLSVV